MVGRTRDRETVITALVARLPLPCSSHPPVGAAMWMVYPTVVARTGDSGAVPRGTWPRRQRAGATSGATSWREVVWDVGVGPDLPAFVNDVMFHVEPPWLQRIRGEEGCLVAAWKTWLVRTDTATFHVEHANYHPLAGARGSHPESCPSLLQAGPPVPARSTWNTRPESHSDVGQVASSGTRCHWAFSIPAAAAGGDGWPKSTRSRPGRADRGRGRSIVR
jgi:hypothetical protein